MAPSLHYDKRNINTHATIAAVTTAEPKQGPAEHLPNQDRQRRSIARLVVVLITHLHVADSLSVLEELCLEGGRPVGPDGSCCHAASTRQAEEAGKCRQKLAERELKEPARPERSSHCGVAVVGR